MPSGLANTNIPGTYTFYAECTSAAPGCRTATNFVINPIPTVDAGPDQTVCNASPAVTLAGTKGGGASSATWSGGAGTYNPNNATLNAIYTPSAGEITAGTATLTLTTDDPAGPCGAVSDQMVITINKTAAITGNPGNQTVCSPGATSFTGAATGTSVTLKWQISTNNGSTWANLSDGGVYSGTGTGTLAISNSAGLNGNQYRLSASTITPCNSTVYSTAATLTVNPLPAAPTGTGNSRCGTGTVTISATPGAGETIDWYNAATAGTLLLSGSNSYTTPSISATTTYYAEARNTTTGCVSSTRTSVTATINSFPATPTITPTNATVCLGSIQSLFSGVTNTVDAPFNSSGSSTIPDNSTTGVTNTITVSGIPAGATINSISVQFNITEGFDGI